MQLLIGPEVPISARSERFNNGGDPIAVGVIGAEKGPDSVYLRFVVGGCDKTRRRIF